MGIFWKVRDGKKIRFWEDHWFGNSSLATQFWPLYVICNQQGKSISQVWDGETLMLSFTRTVSENLLNLWFDLVGIMEEVSLTDEPDHIIWSFSSTGKYSVQSLYAIINNHGVKPVFVHAVWNLSIPPRIQIFLWLLSKNKLLTRDNLAKRRNVDDRTCIFCAEPESIHHLFFDCCVARGLWLELTECLNLNVAWSYEAVASLWLANKKHWLTNVIFAAALWCCWKLRNKICFQGDSWTGMKMLMLWIAKTLRRWRPMFTGTKEEELMLAIQKMELKAVQPPGICWLQSRLPTSGSQPLAVFNAVTQLSSSSRVIKNSLLDDWSV
jgi:hypothetical protein